MTESSTEPELDLSPGQTREQALKVRAIMDAQGKTGKATLANLLAILDEQPLFETEQERQEFLEFVKRVRTSRRGLP